MAEDEMSAMETAGQIPGSCEELFGLWVNNKSGLAGDFQEWPGSRRGASPGQSLWKSRAGDQRCETKRWDWSRTVIP